VLTLPIFFASEAADGVTRQSGELRLRGAVGLDPAPSKWQFAVDFCRAGRDIGAANRLSGAGPKPAWRIDLENVWLHHVNL
jgi:hypothetical protein